MAELVEGLEQGIDGDGISSFDGFEESDFDEDAFGGGVAEAPFVIGEDFHDSGERIGGDLLGLGFEGEGFGLRDLEEVEVAASDLEDEEIAEVSEQIGEEATEVFTVEDEIVKEPEAGFGISGEDGVGEIEDLILRGEAEHGEDVGFLD
jgi:hypothetical protein